MAVKPSKKVKDEVEVTPEVVEVVTPVVEEEIVPEDVIVEVEPVVEVEEPKATVEVDIDNAEVNTKNKPTGLVKIRMRVDHKCTIAMERYDLKAGKTYNVPENVKRILNKAGLLAPL